METSNRFPILSAGAPGDWIWPGDHAAILAKGERRLENRAMGLSFRLVLLSPRAYEAILSGPQEVKNGQIGFHEWLGGLFSANIYTAQGRFAVCAGG